MRIISFLLLAFAATSVLAQEFSNACTNATDALGTIPAVAAAEKDLLPSKNCEHPFTNLGACTTTKTNINVAVNCACTVTIDNLSNYTTVLTANNGTVLQLSAWFTITGTYNDSVIVDVPFVASVGLNNFFAAGLSNTCNTTTTNEVLYKVIQNKDVASILSEITPSTFGNVTISNIKLSLVGGPSTVSTTGTFNATGSLITGTPVLEPVASSSSSSSSSTAAAAGTGSSSSSVAVISSSSSAGNNTKPGGDASSIAASPIVVMAAMAIAAIFA